jgi:hypothetical protein
MDMPWSSTEPALKRHFCFSKIDISDDVLQKWVIQNKIITFVTAEIENNINKSINCIRIMFKKTVLAMALIALPFIGASAQSYKFGHINANEIVASMPEYHQG